MDKDTIIKVDNLSKKFARSIKRSLAYGSIDVARNMVGIQYDTAVLRKGEFWSLKDVSFELKKGEALGIIGQNGSGKTTLLRLINGIFPPDAGSISVRGTIGALIAVGAGFHPHMTGRENIYLNGTILGMTRQEIFDRYDEIIDFADIGDFIDAPVSTYSSGMNIRLGFAIAIHAKPEILLADEVLAVGDLGFALKCYRKISEFREQGGSLLLVSHGMQLIRNTCNNVLWLDKGQTYDFGDTQPICDAYEGYMLQKDASSGGVFGNVINNDPLCHISKVEFLDKDGVAREQHKIGEAFRVRIHYELQRKVKKPIFSVTFVTPENIAVICQFTKLDGFNIEEIDGNGSIDFVIPELNFKPAEYRTTLTFAENDDINNVIEWHDKAHPFIVTTDGSVTYGLVNPFAHWEINK